MGAEISTLSGAAVVGPTTPQTDTQGARVGTMAGAVVVGPTTPQTDVQGVRIATLAAVVVIGPQTGPEGTDRTDLLAIVSNLPISAITQTGTTTQRVADNPEELTTGERTTVEQITVTWSAPPTTEQLATFNRTQLGSPIYSVTHE